MPMWAGRYAADSARADAAPHTSPRQRAAAALARVQELNPTVAVSDATSATLDAELVSKMTAVVLFDAPSEQRVRWRRVAPGLILRSLTRLRSEP